MGSVGAVLVMQISDAECPYFARFSARTAQKSKNLQELYIAATSILGLDGALALSESIFIVRNSMDAIYLLILVALYGATHALVWAFERLGKTP
jgi:hypothetical protein